MSRLDRLIFESRHIRGKWAVAGARPHLLTARPVVVTPLPTLAAYPELTQVTPGKRWAQRIGRRSPRDAPRHLGPHPGVPRPRTAPGVPDRLASRLTRRRASW